MQTNVIAFQPREKAPPKPRRTYQEALRDVQRAANLIEAADELAAAAKPLASLVEAIRAGRVDDAASATAHKTLARAQGAIATFLHYDYRGSFDRRDPEALLPWAFNALRNALANIGDDPQEMMDAAADAYFTLGLLLARPDLPLPFSTTDRDGSRWLAEIPGLHREVEQRQPRLFVPGNPDGASPAPRLAAAVPGPETHAEELLRLLTDHADVVARDYAHVECQSPTPAVAVLLTLPEHLFNALCEYGTERDELEECDREYSDTDEIPASARLVPTEDDEPDTDAEPDADAEANGPPCSFLPALNVVPLFPALH